MVVGRHHGHTHVQESLKNYLSFHVRVKKEVRRRVKQEFLGPPLRSRTSRLDARGTVDVFFCRATTRKAHRANPAWEEEWRCACCLVECATGASLTNLRSKFLWATMIGLPYPITFFEKANQFHERSSKKRKSFDDGNLPERARLPS